MCCIVRCSSFKVFQSHWAVDSQGDLCLHRGANGNAGQAENSYMGDISAPGGKIEQVCGNTLKAANAY